NPAAADADRPQLQQHGAVENRVEDADQQGKGADKGDLGGKIAGGKLSGADEDHGKDEEGDQGGQLVSAEGDHADDEDQCGQDLGPGIEPVQRAAAAGQAVQPLEIE